MNVLITGGVGFIGTNCAAWFAEQGVRVCVVDNLSRAGVEQNAAYLKQYFPKINILKIEVQSVRQNQKFIDELKAADLIIHLAGQTAVTNSIQDPEHDFKNNLYAGFLLLEALRQYNPQAVVFYASTNKVYGNLSHHELKLDKKKKVYQNLTSPNGVDETEQLEFISPYGCSKGALDQYFLEYARGYQLQTVVFRQSCIYGPHQIGVEDQGWVAHFSKQILSKQPITIFGDGCQVRDLLFVDDLVEAYQLAYQQIDQAAGQVFNIGGGLSNAYSLLQVIKMLEQLADQSAEIKFDEARLGDQRWFVSDNSKLKNLLGWQPAVGFKSGLSELVDWQRQFLNLRD